jgi:hypothetical protein
MTKEKTMTEIDCAIATRFNHIKDSFVQKEGDFIYDGGRCIAEKLGWRFEQNTEHRFNVEDVESGKCDTDIERTWHDAASAEYWYRYEKRWD